MKFILLDRILELEPGQRIAAIKNLSLAEEYLADHFPRFPVMPGVLMLEAMVQASAWLIRVTDDFAHSLITLKEVRNIKYASFVQPGQTLTIESSIQKRTANETQLNALGRCGEVQMVSAKLTLLHVNAVDSNPNKEVVDTVLRQELKKQLCLLWQPAVAQK